MHLYNYEGSDLIELYKKGNNFYDNMSIRHYRNVDANTSYTVAQIFKKKIDGTYQYPFIRIIPTEADRKTAYDLARREGWDFVINGGGWEGPAIENSTVVLDDAPWYQPGGCIITIDGNGDFGYKDNVVAGDAAQLVAQGIVSAFYHFFPLIVNYNNYDYPTDIPYTFGDHNWEVAQKQIIGQYENGDYCIITAEGRGFANSVGFTVPQIQSLCKNMGLKFAYHLDGGGSTQTVMGLKHVNHIYEGTSGRLLPGFIVFNGTNTFSIPNA